jgi:preprotein translocase subunit SecD
MMCSQTRTCVALLFAACAAPCCRAAAPPQKLADGVYAVRRDAARKADVLPLKAGETLTVNHHRYAKQGGEPRFVVVGTSPDVTLDLAGAPEAIKDGEEVTGILLKLRPGAAKALERLTGERTVRQVAVVIGGEVVTMHKVRGAIKGGEVKITSCAPKAAGYLLDQLRAARRKN